MAFSRLQDHVPATQDIALLVVNVDLNVMLRVLQGSTIPRLITQVAPLQKTVMRLVSIRLTQFLITALEDYLVQLVGPATLVLLAIPYQDLLVFRLLAQLRQLVALMLNPVLLTQQVQLLFLRLAKLDILALQLTPAQQLVLR